MGRKIYCENASCKHHCKNDVCDTTVKIDSSGKCESFEKGFVYYFHIVWRALEKKNFIDMIELQQNPDLRIGLYYVMDCYGLGFAEMEFGTCRMLMLKAGENEEPLNYEKIVAREINMEKLNKNFENFNAGIMPKAKEKESQREYIEKEFGWLSPIGEFIESPFGRHEESAEEICQKQGFVDEYQQWVENTGGNEIGHPMRDFLAEIKGYCLVHNPSGYNGYIVTNIKELTKKQKEFLYGYFMDMGDEFKAEQFLES